MDNLETRIRGFLKAIHSHGIAYRRNATSFPTKLFYRGFGDFSRLPTRETGPQIWTLGGYQALDVRGNVTTRRDTPGENVGKITWYHHGLVLDGTLTKAGESVLAELERFDLVFEWSKSEFSPIDLLSFKSRSDVLPLERLDPDWSALDPSCFTDGMRSKVLETVAASPYECATCLVAPALRVAFLHSLFLISRSCDYHYALDDVEAPIIKCLSASGFMLFDEQREVRLRTGLALLKVVKALSKKSFEAPFGKKKRIEKLTTKAIAKVCLELTYEERKALEVVFYDGDACSFHKIYKRYDGETVECLKGTHPLDHHRPWNSDAAYAASINKLWQLGEGYSVMAALSETSQLAWA